MDGVFRMASYRLASKAGFALRLLRQLPNYHAILSEVKRQREPRTRQRYVLARTLCDVRIAGSEMCEYVC